MIRTKVGRVFRVVREGDGVGGFTWHYDIDSKFLSLVKIEYGPAPKELIGGGIDVIMWFEALSPGSTKIELVLMRPWNHERSLTEYEEVEIEA